MPTELTRRQWLHLAGSVGITGVTGCSSITDPGNQSEANPRNSTADTATTTSSTEESHSAAVKDKLKAYVSALETGDAEQAKRVLHPDSDGRNEILSYLDGEREFRPALTLQSVSIGRVSDLSMSVTATVEVDVPGGWTKTRTVDQFWENTDDGGWRLDANDLWWETGIAAGPPAASLSFEYSARSAELTITHTSGEPFEDSNTEELRIVGPEETKTIWGNDSAFNAYPVEVGDSVTVSASSGETVKVVWESDGGRTRTIAQYTVE